MQEEIDTVRSLYYTVRTDQYARIGHRIIGLQNDILVFGGVSPNGDYNSTVIKIDCETMTLDFVHTKNTLKLQGFSIFALEEAIYFWGGTGPSKQDGRVSLCQNKLLKFVGNQFIQVSQKGRVPASRQYHASCLVSGKYLIIMGGNNGKSFFNDWHLLELSCMTWTQLSLNQIVPPFLDAQIFWYGGRGFLLSGQIYDTQQDTLLTENKLYEFRFRDFKAKKMDLEQIHISDNCRQKLPRGSPSVVFVPLQSPYLVLLGGSYSCQQNPMKITNEVECFNLQTLEWFSISSAIKAGFAFQALYCNQKIYFVGGMTGSGDIAHFVEYMQLKVNYLEAKVCKVCRQVYGFKQLNIKDRNVLSIKVEADLSPKYFFSSQIIGRMALYIGYPFSALGLLLDNSLNLSGTNIDIEFGFMTPGDKEAVKSSMWRQGSQPYDYISIIDNSYGFTQHEILECLNTFSLKTQKFTSDKRFEDEVQIRKEYGNNLKLGALRIGQSCMFITKTEDRSKLYAYFSVNSYYSSAPFSVLTYLVSPEGNCSSEINRQIIKENVKDKIPANFEDISAPTIVFLFDLKRRELVLRTDEEGNKQITYRQALSRIYRNLDEYIQSLYLKPYKGRRVAVNGREIKFRSYLELLKKDEQKGDLTAILEEDYPKQIFSCFNLYKINVQNYFLRNILCYHKNRLIFTVNGIESRYCGIVELSDAVKIDICKTKIQNRSDQLSFHRIIRSILNKYETKRVPKVGFKPLLVSSKDSSIGQQILRDNDENSSRLVVNQRPFK